MMTRRLAACLLVALLAVALAQTCAGAPLPPATALVDIPHPAPPDTAGTGGALMAGYHQALLAYYGAVRDAYRQRTRAFAWQLASSEIVFAMTVLIVLAGVGMAMVHFIVGVRSRRTPRRGTTPAPQGPREATTTVSLTAGRGLRITSPAIGLIILLVSLAFFYLYLVYVYPIRDAARL